MLVVPYSNGLSNSLNRFLWVLQCPFCHSWLYIWHSCYSHYRQLSAVNVIIITTQKRDGWLRPGVQSYEVLNTRFLAIKYPKECKTKHPITLHLSILYPVKIQMWLLLKTKMFIFVGSRRELHETVVRDLRWRDLFPQVWNKVYKSQFSTLVWQYLWSRADSWLNIM